MITPKFSGAYYQAADWLYSVAQTHNGENLWVDINGASVFLVQRLAEADHVLRINAQNYKKNMTWFRNVLGFSRFSEDGQSWEIRRDLTQYHFSKFDRERTFKIAGYHAQKAIEQIAEDSLQGQNSLSEDKLRYLAYSVLVENFFEFPLSDIGISLDNLAGLIELGSEYGFVPAVDKNLKNQSLKALPGLRRQLFEDFKIFRTGNLPVSPLLERMLNADKDPSNNIQLEHELLTFFVAGADTTASALGWACYLLARYPDIQAKLSSDLQRFWQGSEHSWKKLSQIESLEAFVSESIRLFPPTPIVTRLACEKDHVGGCPINAGDNVCVSIIGVQHDGNVHTDPWRPNLAAYRDSQSSGTNVGFIFGPRMCGGKKFALTELTTFLAVFLREANFTLLNEAEPKFYWRTVMLRAGGQPVCVSLNT